MIYNIYDTNFSKYNKQIHFNTEVKINKTILSIFLFILFSCTNPTKI